MPSPHAKSRSIAFSIIVPLLLISSPAAIRGQLLDYGPFAGYGLKKGILGNDYANPLAACITGAESPEPASHASVRVSITYNSDEYKQAFHIDQKAEATYLNIAGGGEELHFGQETGHSESAFDIIIEAYGEHDGQTINNIKWDAPYANMIASGDPAKINQVRLSCGDRYIQTVFYESRLFAVLHVSRRQASSLMTFSGQTHGQVGISAVQASASLGGDARVSSAHKGGAITVDVYSEGLGGIAPTAQAVGIASEDGIEDVAAKLAAKVAQYVSSLKDLGQPVKYRLALLPGVGSGDLLQERVFERIRDLKSRYEATHFRLDNIDALLQNPADPRRSMYNEPQADTLLQNQQKAVSTYLDSVATAHDGCKKAPNLAACLAAEKQVGSPPPQVPVELPPLVPPAVSLFMFAIDGVPLQPGQNPLMLAAGKSLFELARTINPQAKVVDVIAGIDGGFLSYVDFPIFTPQPAPKAAIGFGIYRLLADQLSWPAYWKGTGRGNLGIRLIHADADHPCPISLNNGLSTIASDCLTEVGRSFSDFASILAAQYAANMGSGVYDTAIGGTAMNCFGMPSSLPLGSMHIEVTSTPPNFASVRYGLLLPMGNLFLPLIEASGTNDVPMWRQLAQQQMARLSTAYGTSAAAHLCLARVP